MSRAAAQPVAPAARPLVSPDSPARRDHLLRSGYLRNETPAQAPAAEGLRIDDALRHVSIDGEAVDFTYKEFELLAYLARNARRIITREELMETVWQDGAGDTGERTIDVHIRRVRNKLAQHRNVVTTVRGVGYRFDPTPQVRFREARAF
ncbi:winged helix-turn-helix transcriptional regulator [Micrococcales bacterium 31B]|nr:winged helix-turn-helix transcriptional regulator [Micrococcales bacterium 31B]